MNYLTLAVEANEIKEKVSDYKFETELFNIVPSNSTVNPKDLAIYEMGSDGELTLLDDYKGLPSDENKLNGELGRSNEAFAKLLEIESKL